MRYQQFWQTLVHRLVRAYGNAITNHTGGKIKAEDILRRLIEQLSNLSTIAVVNIRDSVMEAVLSMGDSLSEVCQTLKGQKDVAERQLQAAQGIGSNSSNVTGSAKKGNNTPATTPNNNPKVKAFAKQRDEIQKVKYSLFHVV